MRRRIIQKGNLRRGDALRAVVTDTLPEEVPIIFSNDGFYRNRTRSDHGDANASAFIDALFSPERGYTIPYRFSVLRDESSTRGLNLLHPIAQERVAQFYRSYDDLICHYARRSVASLRAPHKVGSTFFVKSASGSPGNLRRAAVDTVSLETSVATPASYFSYSRYNRAHQFFSSRDYLNLEKKYKVFRTLDVSKCFNSIYTHTLAWAIWDIDTAKENTQASSFANDFDSLMQFMNYRETNGICIGPEVSRIFAETIFSEIDVRVIEGLARNRMKWKTDFEFRRYVDDFYVFAQDEDSANQIMGAVQQELQKFNLHLNFEKVKTLHRPFSTKISQVVADTNVRLNAIFSKFIDYQVLSTGSMKSRLAYPKRIMRSDSLLRSAIHEIKAVCNMHGLEYGVVSDYVISALTNRVSELADGFTQGILLPNVTEDDYVSAHMLLLELVYFFYTVNPTVRSSLNVARSVVTSAELFSNEFQPRLSFLAESVVRWTLDLVRSMISGSKHDKLAAVPVEILNVLIPMREVASNEPLIDELVGSMCERVESFEYFQIISFLYLVGGKPQHRNLISKLFTQAKAVVAASHGPRIDAQAAHLCLDLLACPHLPLEKRASWFNALRRRSGLPGLSRGASQAAVASLRDSPWFVSWEGVSLSSVLRKKELSPVY